MAPFQKPFHMCCVGQALSEEDLLPVKWFIRGLAKRLADLCHLITTEVPIYREVLGNIRISHGFLILLWFMETCLSLSHPFSHSLFVRSQCLVIFLVLSPLQKANGKPMDWSCSDLTCNVPSSIPAHIKVTQHVCGASCSREAWDWESCLASKT